MRGCLHLIWNTGFNDLSLGWKHDTVAHVAEDSSGNDHPWIDGSCDEHHCDQYTA